MSSKQEMNQELQKMQRQLGETVIQRNSYAAANHNLHAQIIKREKEQAEQVTDLECQVRVLKTLLREKAAELVHATLPWYKRWFSSPANLTAKLNAAREAVTQ